MRGFLFCLILLGAAGFGAYYFGWISFETTEDGKTQISIDNEKIRNDTNKAIDKGRNVIDNAQEKLNKDKDADQGGSSGDAAGQASDQQAGDGS
ncbi:MAG: hypothetical protein MPJ50_13940 [Pirellulales bacterium]|nr:hypothetical protein [Pirellulales bacterium]